MHHDPQLFVRANDAIAAVVAIGCGGIVLGYAVAARRYWWTAPAALLILGSGIFLLRGVFLEYCG